MPHLKSYKREYLIKYVVSSAESSLKAFSMTSLWHTTTPKNVSGGWEGGRVGERNQNYQLDFWNNSL